MSVELNLLKFFCDAREVEILNYGYLDMLDNMEREVKLLFNLVHTYYKDFEKEDSIEFKDLLSYYDLNYPKARSREMHLDLLTQMYNIKTNPELMKAHLDQLLEKHKATQIVNKLMPVLEGEKYGILDTIGVDIDNYVELLSNPPDSLVVPEPCELSVEELVTQEILEGGYPWHISGLTDIVGGVRPKTLGLIYAFVDAGKTSFGMASCAGFARQIVSTKDRIVYAGNEESAPRLRLRLIQSLLGWTRSQVRDDIKGAQSEAYKRGLGNVLIFDQITAGEQIEYILKEHKPIIMYVDQSTDVDLQLSRKREGVDYLKALFKWYRGLATKHDCGIIGVAQGTGTAEDTKYLKLSDIYGARVAIQGALDYAIGIGKLESDPIDSDQRYINVPKNKLADGCGGKFAVMFNHFTNTWQEI
jgi:hypothetical protein